MDPAAFGLAAPNNAVKFYYSKRKQSSSSARSAVSRQLLRNELPPLCCSEEWELGAFYEIDHAKLPPKSPIHLKAVRIVKVSETSKLNVTVSFPSTFSLRNYFSANKSVDEVPDLDERFVMSTNHAGEILRRLVPSSEMREEKHQQGFWLVAPFVFPSESSPKMEEDEEEEEEEEDDDEEEETEHNMRLALPPLEDCQLALKYLGVPEWGIRRKVKYVGRQRELPQGLLQSVNRSIDHQVQEEMSRDEQTNTVTQRKRSREASCKKKTKKKNKGKKKGKEKKKPRYSSTENNFRQVKCEKVDQKSSSTPERGGGFRERWSEERYKTAELKLLSIMREKGAEIGNPILRPELREEARKHIGDTGLLDHLLKHMAGKVVTDGCERFRRRHNGEGAMEYWLEPADLVEIREKAGVVDPYWVPPPGWKLGDATTQCLCGTECRKDILQLWDEIAILKTDIGELLSLKQLEDKAKNSEADQSKADCKVWQEKYERLQEGNAKLETEMAEVVVSLKGLQNELMSLKKAKEMKEEEEQKQHAIIADPMNTGMIEDGNKGSIITSGNKSGVGSSSGGAISKAQATTMTPTTKNKGGGGVRKSGFRICKPQGTFLWPNMGVGVVGGGGSTSISNKMIASTTSITTPPNSYVGSAMVPSTTNTNCNILFGDGGIPTPPSCSSSATSAPNLLLLPSPTGTPTSSPFPPAPANSGALSLPLLHLHQVSTFQNVCSCTLPSPAPSNNRSYSSPPCMTATAVNARAPPSSSVINKNKRGADEDIGGGGGLGWSSITTDLVLATPSPSYQHLQQF